MNGNPPTDEFEFMQLRPLSRDSGEETPMLIRNGADTLENQTSGSIESLREIEEDGKIDGPSVNNNSKRTAETVIETLLISEQYSFQPNLLRRSESEKEMEVKDSSKRKKDRKKKGVKRNLRKDLPPILITSKRSLPKLAAVDESVESVFKV